MSILSGERGQPGDVTLEESAENLKGKEMLLSGAQGLSECQRVKPRLSLPLIRIRYFVVSLIPWSEAQSRPPSPQNTSL